MFDTLKTIEPYKPASRRDELWAAKKLCTLVENK
jgi:hypothetical protein